MLFLIGLNKKDISSDTGTEDVRAYVAIRKPKFINWLSIIL